MSQETSEFFRIDRQEKDRIQQELASLLKTKMSLQQALKQQQETAESKQEELFLELLEIYDSLEFFLDYLIENPEPNPKFYQRLPKSFATIKDKLTKILAKREVKAIELHEDSLDYTACQVVEREIRADLPDKKIVKTVRQGFTVRSKVLRPSEIILSQKPSHRSSNINH